MSIKKLLFVDTNIWLDFYRVRNDAGLALLRHAEAVSGSIIVTYQLESEFKKNRQAAILEGMQELKPPSQIPRPAIFSDAKSTQVLNKSLKEAEKRVKDLKVRLTRALENPTANDPVYQTCQRIFHKFDSLVLRREDPKKAMIRRKAFRRFLHGCPPRKKNDTSYGDAFNWEWMIHCATVEKAELVIVSRDSDFGAQFDNRVYVNDHLRQEFSDRVSKKRKLFLYTRLSEALKHFSVPVSEREVEAEAEIVQAKFETVEPKPNEAWARLVEIFEQARQRSESRVPPSPEGS
jgi:PIN domain-containing protein